MKLFLLVSMLIASTPCFGYGKYLATARLKDGNPVTVTLNVTAKPMFVFSPALSQKTLQLQVINAVQLVMVDFDTKTLMKDIYIFKVPLREAIDQGLQFHGYKMDEMTVVSVEIKEKTND